MSVTKHLLAVLVLAWSLDGEIVLAAVDWVDWRTFIAASRTVTGVAGPVSVEVTGTFNPAPQLGFPGEENWWSCCVAAYSTPDIPGPTTSDMIRLVGGPGTGIYTLHFSQPVTNPVMAVASLGGASAVRTSFVFDTPFTILTTGLAGAWGLGTPLRQTGLTLDGMESNGLIQFSGTLSTITWTLPTTELWFGFSVGVVTVATPPVPSTPARLNAALSWDYTAEDEVTLLETGGFRLYEGIGLDCDQPDPLPVSIAQIGPTVRTYARMNAPVQDERLCYELTAFNEVGESWHSNRATILASELAPAAPTGLIIEMLGGDRRERAGRLYVLLGQYGSGEERGE